MDLRALNRPDESVDHRDGLAAMMAFVAAYADQARDDEPATWAGLRTPRVADMVRRLWSRAERVMASSCGIPRYGTRDKGYLREVCALGSGSALATLLGRAPVCADGCLSPTPDVDTGDVAVEATSAGADDAEAEPARHPFADAAAPRRHRVAGASNADAAPDDQ